MSGLTIKPADVMATLRRGFGASGEDRATAAMVAAPFSGAIGIFINALTWWPDMLTLGITLLIWITMALWIAGNFHPDKS